MSIIDQIEEKGIDVCEDAEAWIESHPGLGLQGLWEICPRADWMLFLLIETGASAPFHEMTYEFAAHAVTYVSPELRDAYCDTLDMMSRCLDDEATFDDMAAARAEARAASVAWDAENAAVDSVLAAVDSARDAGTADSAAVWAARSAARASARAASAAWVADWAAASAAWVADWAAACAARPALVAALSAQDNSAAWAAACAARDAWAATLAAQANIIRCFVPVAPELTIQKEIGA